MKVSELYRLLSEQANLDAEVSLSLDMQKRIPLAGIAVCQEHNMVILCGPAIGGIVNQVTRHERN